MASPNFSNIIGPPCDEALNKASELTDNKKYIESEQTTEAKYKIYYKKVINTTYTYYISSEDDKYISIPQIQLPSNSKFLFGEDRGKGKYFTCPFVKNNIVFDKDTETEKNDNIPYIFEVTSKTHYLVFNNKTWRIDAGKSNIEIIRTNPGTNPYTAKETFKDYGLINNYINIGIIPNKIFQSYITWSNNTFNYFGSFGNNEVFEGNEEPVALGQQTFTCLDDCEREIKLNISKFKQVKSRKYLIKCLNLDCSSNIKGKIVHGPQKPTISECEIIEPPPKPDPKE